MVGSYIKQNVKKYVTSYVRVPGSGRDKDLDATLCDLRKVSSIANSVPINPTLPSTLIRQQQPPQELAKQPPPLSQKRIMNEQQFVPPPKKICQHVQQQQQPILTVQPGIIIINLGSSSELEYLRNENIQLKKQLHLQQIKLNELNKHIGEKK